MKKGQESNQNKTQPDLNSQNRKKKKNKKKSKKGVQSVFADDSLQNANIFANFEESAVSSVRMVPEEKNQSKDSISQAFKAFGQPGSSKTQSTAAETPMKSKNQPYLNGKSQRRTAQTVQHIERSPVIMKQLKDQHILPADIYGMISYDLEKIYSAQMTLVRQYTNQFATTQMFSKKVEMAKILSSAIFIGLAQQIQNTMSVEQSLNDPLRGFLTSEINIMPFFQNLIHTFGAFKSERGHFHLETANTYVLQLYSMAISKICEVDQETKMQHGYQNPAFFFPTPLELTDSVFVEHANDAEKFVYSKMRKVWQRHTEPKVFQHPRTHVFEQYPKFDRLFQPGGSQWAEACSDQIAMSIINVHEAIVNGDDYSGHVNALGLSTCDFLLVPLLAEIKKVIALIQATQRDAIFGGAFVVFKPLRIDQVCGRWQLMQTTTNETKFKSKFVVREDEAQYGCVLNAIERVNVVQSLRIAPQQHPNVLINEGLSQDLLK